MIDRPKKLISDYSPLGGVVTIRRKCRRLEAKEFLFIKWIQPLKALVVCRISDSNSDRLSEPVVVADPESKKKCICTDGGQSSLGPASWSGRGNLQSRFSTPIPKSTCTRSTGSSTRIEATCAGAPKALSRSSRSRTGNYQEVRVIYCYTLLAAADNRVHFGRTAFGLAGV